MAWFATDNAESYSNGNAINTLNGGTDWSGAWSKAGAGGTADIINTPTLQGSLCFRLVGGNSGEPEALRSFTCVTSGSASFIVRSNTALLDSVIFGFEESTTRKATYWMDGGNNLVGFGHHVLYNGASTDLGAYSADTNYTIIMDFDCSTDQFRISVNGGSTFSSWANFESTATSITRIRYRLSRTQTAVNTSWYFDDIKPYSAVVGPVNMKTRNGLASASVKTIDGLAIASVKTVNGLT